MSVGTGADRADRAGAALGPFSALRGLLARPLASYHLLLAASGLLLVIGLVMVLSATSVSSYQKQGNAFAEATRQAAWAAVGLVVFWITHRLPARTYRVLGAPLLVVSMVLLAILAVFPNTGGSALGTDDLWILVAGVQIQPSELAKFALVLWGADLLVRKGDRIRRLQDLAVPLFPVTALLFLLVGYRDLGTMICLLLIFLTLLWVRGVRFRVFGIMFAMGLAGIMLLIGAEPYRFHRLLSFGNPGKYRESFGYQAVQGYYALADGGWFGVGLGESRQKWAYLPNRHNDFIFAILAEELGVVGSVVVLALFAVLAYAGLRIARRVDDPFRQLVAAGCTVWICGQAVINVSAVVGLLPITGLPLPFISDGGSALVVVLAAVGMLASFARAEPAAARALHARPPRRLVQVLWAPLPPRPAKRRGRNQTN